MPPRFFLAAWREERGEISWEDLTQRHGGTEKRGPQITRIITEGRGGRGKWTAAKKRLPSPYALRGVSPTKTPVCFGIIALAYYVAGEYVKNGVCWRGVFAYFNFQYYIL